MSGEYTRLLIGLGVILAAALAPPGLWAAEAGPGGEPAAISRATYDALQAAERLGDLGRGAEAVDLLDARLAKLDATSFEGALLLRSRGYLAVAREDPVAAVADWRQALAAGVLPPEQRQRLLYDLAQVYLGMGAYRRGAATLERWLEGEPDPTPQALVLLGGAYAELARYPEAARRIRAGIARHPAAPEAWHQLLLGVLYRAGDYRGCTGVLETLVRLRPEKAGYWLQLASMHAALEQHAEALAVLEAAYLRGVLTGAADLVRLAHQYLDRDVPYKAAALLAREMASGRIPPTRQHWDLLAHAWLRADERARAAQALGEAARLSGDGRRYLELARMELDRERWDQAIEALDKARRQGGLEAPGDTYLLQGMALHGRGSIQAAVESFTRALAYASSETLARQWLAYLASGPTATPGIGRD